MGTSVVGMGLIKGVESNMVLTTPFCPLAKVKITLGTEPWKSSMMNQQGTA
ncbi:MAG: hypothetical protein ACE5OS_10785 [Anaerolineae bacterium]